MRTRPDIGLITARQQACSTLCALSVTFLAVYPVTLFYVSGQLTDGKWP